MASAHGWGSSTESAPRCTRSKPRHRSLTALRKGRWPLAVPATAQGTISTRHFISGRPWHADRACGPNSSRVTGRLQPAQPPRRAYGEERSARPVMFHSSFKVAEPDYADSPVFLALRGGPGGRYYSGTYSGRFARRTAGNTPPTKAGRFKNPPGGSYSRISMILTTASARSLSGILFVPEH